MPLPAQKNCSLLQSPLRDARAHAHARTHALLVGAGVKGQRARTQQIEHETAPTLVGDSLRAKKRDKRCNLSIPPARVAARTLTRVTDKKQGVTQLGPGRGNHRQ